MKSKKKKQKQVRRKRKNNRVANLSAVVHELPPEILVKPSGAWWTWAFLPGFVIFSAIVIYAYLPTFEWFLGVWKSEPDYGHGFLVAPLACMIAYYRADSFPGLRQSKSYAGLLLILLAILMRVSGRMAYADFLDGWSLIPLLAGVVWFLFGFRAMKWALPTIGFLFFMIPLPYQAESLLSWKLQGVATQLSTIMLRVLGQPAVSEGHIVWVYGEQLLIEQACSGLRIFVGVGALAYFWAAISNRSVIDKLVLLAAAIPIAIIANAMRITVIGLLYSWFDQPFSRHQIHDLTGFAMIPLAFVLLGIVRWYWELLYRPVHQATAKDFLNTVQS